MLPSSGRTLHTPYTFDALSLTIYSPDGGSSVDSRSLVESAGKHPTRYAHRVATASLVDRKTAVGLGVGVGVGVSPGVDVGMGVGVEVGWGVGVGVGGRRAASSSGSHCDSIVDCH